MPTFPAAQASRTWPSSQTGRVAPASQSGRTFPDFGATLSPSKVTLFARRHSFTTMAAGSTTVAYQPVAGTEYFYAASGGPPVEAVRQATAPAAFTFSGFGAQGAANTLSTATVTQRFRKNGANGNQVVTHAPGAFLFASDSSNTDTVVANDTFSTSLVMNSGGTGSFTPAATRVIMEMGDTNDHWMMYRGFSNNTIAAGAGAIALSVCGYNSGATVPGDIQAAWARNKWRCAATVEALAFTLLANSMSVDVTLYLTVNGSNTAMTATMSAGSTSRVVFSGGPITLADGDVVAIEATVGAGTGTFQIAEIEMWTKTSRLLPQAMQIACHVSGNIINVAGGWTRYLGISGSAQPSNTTAPAVACIHGFAGQASKASVYLRANASTTTVTYAYEVAGVASSVGVSVPTLGTGWYDDTGGATATWSATDECAWKVSRASGSGSHTPSCLCVVEEYVSG